MRKFIGLTALALLGACSNVDWAALESQMQFANLEAEAARTVDESYRDLLFDSGVVYVVANEHGDLHTYSRPHVAAPVSVGPMAASGMWNGLWNILL
ncbi:hypothetical protein OAD19_03210 [Octadecabacter sp.]|nr:hypothetical protein [Octadecabacter sp.]